jgi:hypothetical protein
MDDPNVWVWGHKITKAEFDLYLEIVKSTLFAAAGGAIAYMFTLLSKRREQDDALFNELIKGRISSAHSVNQAISKILGEYHNLVDVDRFERRLIFTPQISSKDQTGSPEDTRDEVSRAMRDQFGRNIDDFIKNMPKRFDNVVLLLRANRYVLGEDKVDDLTRCLREIERSIRMVWRFYLYQVLEKGPKSEDFRAQYNWESGQRRSAALYNERLIRKYLRYIEITFEDVIRSKAHYDRQTSAVTRIVSAVSPRETSVMKDIDNASIQMFEEDLIIWSREHEYLR